MIFFSSQNRYSVYLPPTNNTCLLTNKGLEKHHVNMKHPSIIWRVKKKPTMKNSFISQEVKKGVERRKENV